MFVFFFFFFPSLDESLLQALSTTVRKKPKRKSPRRRTSQLLDDPQLSAPFLRRFGRKSPDCFFFPAVDMSLPCVKSIRATQRPLRIVFRVQTVVQDPHPTPPHPPSSGCHSDIGVTGDQEPEELHAASTGSIKPPRKYSCLVVLPC